MSENLFGDGVNMAEVPGVAPVLEAGVRCAGSTVRISAKRIRAAVGSHLWSQTVDRPLVVRLPASGG